MPRSNAQLGRAALCAVLVVTTYASIYVYKTGATGLLLVDDATVQRCPQ